MRLKASEAGNSLAWNSGGVLGEQVKRIVQDCGSLEPYLYHVCSIDAYSEAVELIFKHHSHGTFS